MADSPSGYASLSEPEHGLADVGLLTDAGYESLNPESVATLSDAGYESLDPESVATLSEVPTSGRGRGRGRARGRGRPKKCAQFESADLAEESLAIVEAQLESTAPAGEPLAEAQLESPGLQIAAVLTPKVVGFFKSGLALMPPCAVTDRMTALLTAPAVPVVGAAQTYIFNRRLPLEAGVKPVRSSTWTAESNAATALCGTSEVVLPKTYKNRYFESAESILYWTRAGFASLVATVRRMLDSPRYEGVALVLSGSSDEASAKLQVKYKDVVEPADGEGGEVATVASAAPDIAMGASVEPARVIQSDLRVGMLLRDKEGPHPEVFLTARLPLCLVSADRCTSEVLTEIQKDCYDLPGLTNDFKRLFTCRYVTHTQDKCNSNEKQVYAARCMHDKDAEGVVQDRLALGCDLHRAATTNTRTYELTRSHISGMLSLAIAERAPGRFAALKRAIGEYCTSPDRLRIIRGQQISPEAKAYRDRVVDFLLPLGHWTTESGEWLPGSISRQIQRQTYDRCFNGDIRDPDHIFLHVDHDAESDDKIRKSFKRDAPLALCPELLRHYPRHRWTGAQGVTLNVALLALTHNLLETVLAIWAKSEEAAPVAGSALPPFDRRAAAAIAAPESGYASDREPEQACHDEDPNEVVVPMAPDTKEDMPEFNKKVKMTVSKWLRLHPTAAVCIMARIGAPLDNMLKAIMFRSGQSWEDASHLDAVHGAKVRFRLCESQSNSVEKRAAMEALHLMLQTEPWEILLPAQRTRQNSHLAFRMLSRLAGALLMLLVVPHEQMPYKLFSLLYDPSLAALIADTLLCMRDDFSHAHIERYPKEALGSSESLSVLRAIASLTRTDTANIETGHSFWQRESRVRGVQTVADSVPASSATFVMHRQREDECSRDKPAPKPIGRKRKRTQAPEAPSGGQKSNLKRSRVRGSARQADLTVVRHGGGGPWRRYIRTDAVRTPSGKFAQGHGAAYRVVQEESPEKFASLIQIGAAATLRRATSSAGSAFGLGSSRT
jgi:hypothetical protein